MKFLSLGLLVIILSAVIPPSTLAASLVVDEVERPGEDHQLRRVLSYVLAEGWHHAARELNEVSPAMLSSEDQDRYALLAGAIALALKDQEAMRSLLERVPTGEKVGAWLRFQLALMEAGTQGAVGWAEITPELETLFGDSEILRHYIAYLASLSHEGGGVTMHLERVLEKRAKNALEMEVVGAAAWELAKHALSQGEAPELWLEQVPPTSNHFGLARYCLDQTETLGGVGFTDLKQSGAESRFELMQRASRQLESEAFEDAVQTYEYARESLHEEFRSLETFAQEDASDLYWDAWHRQSGEAFFNLSAAFWHGELGAWFRSAANFNTKNIPLPEVSGPTVSRVKDRVPAPSVQDLKEVRLVSENWFSADRFRAERDFALREEEERVGKRLAYLNRGEQLTRAAGLDVDETAQRFKVTQESLDQLLVLLEETKNRVLMHLEQQRTLGRQQVLVHEVWANALAYFYDREPAPSFPEELPTAYEGQLLAREKGHLDFLSESLDVLGAEVPDRVIRSYEQRWLPDLEERVRRIQAKLSRQEALIASILQGIEDHGVYEASNPTLLASREAAIMASEAARSAQTELGITKAKARMAAIESERQALRSEEEGLDYSVAVAHYERAVFAPGYSDTLSLARTAIASNETFVATYPDAPGVAYSKFRLADLYATSAKDAFREDMARFLSADRQGPTPILEVDKPLHVYTDLLETAPDFEHRDAVLFNLGILKLDAGDASGGPLLEELIATFPDSEFLQEAHLRVGDHLFSQGAYSESVPHFEIAAKESDPSLAAIALYQLGWAEFRRDDFAEAVDAFRRLMDLYDDENVQLTMLKSDLRPEAEGYLVHGLVRAGGAAFFESYFAETGPRSYESTVLLQMEAIFRDAALFDDAVAVAELYLHKYPEDALALSMAERILISYEDANEDELAQKYRLDFAKRFRKDSEWSKEVSDSLKTAGDKFAYQSLRTAATFEHEDAQDTNSDAAWAQTFELYEALLHHWPNDKHAPKTSLYAGEAAQRLKQFEAAMDHYGRAAASDTASFAEEASWRKVTTTDAWHTHLVGNKEDGSQVAEQLRLLARAFAAGYPSSEHGFDGIWRGAQLALQYEKHQEAASDFSELASRYPNHARAPLAGALAGDVMFEAKDFAGAARGYERALGLAERSGQDSLLVRVSARIPLSYYRNAEQVRDDKGLGEAAPEFEQLAMRFPKYEHAPQALYQSGLGYFENKKLSSGLRVMNDLLVRYPDHELARDTHLQIAAAHESGGSKRDAAQAYRRYALAYKSEADAVESYLHAMTLLTEAEEKGTLDTLRREFLTEFPDESDVVMEILHDFAKRELTQVSTERPVSERLQDKTSDLAAYVAKSKESADLADPDLLGEIAFLQAEEVLAPYLETYLRLPLDKSIDTKKQQLETVLAAYQRCAEEGSETWSNAASFRTGYALIHFGDRLEQSERPNLGAEDLLAYDEVIGEEAWTFFDKGEGIWEELLRTRAEASEDPGNWLEKTRKYLWPRLAERFFFRPEMEYPRVEPKEPKAREMAVSSEALPDEGSSKE